MLDGLLAGITREDIDKMPPVYRQRLAQALRRAIDMLERPHAKPLQEPQDGRSHLPAATGHGRAGRGAAPAGSLQASPCARAAVKSR